MNEFIWRSEKGHKCYRLGISKLFIQWTETGRIKQFLIRVCNRAFAIASDGLKTWKIND